MSEPTLNEKIIPIAEYDNWLQKEEGSLIFQKATNGKVKECHFNDFPYHTSLDAIAPVALKVRDEISELFYDMKESNPFFNTDSHKKCLKTLNELNGAIMTLDPLAIFEATYNAIILLKKYEK